MEISTPAFLPHCTSFIRAAGLALGLFLAAPVASQAQTWMVSTDAYIKMGVMDKYGALGTYTAKFVVTNTRSGKSYLLVKEVPSGQNGIDVIFPSPPSEPDYFKTEAGEAGRAQPGAYTWECQVSGKKVVGGRFTFPETANDITTIIADKK